MAKGKCPVCNLVGYLQVLNKGKYARIRRYDRMEQGKLVFHYHQIPLEDANGILALDREVSKPKPYNLMTPMTNSNDQKAITNDSERDGLALEYENKGARSLGWIRTLACGAGDPGFKSQRARQKLY